MKHKTLLISFIICSFILFGQYSLGQEQSVSQKLPNDKGRVLMSLAGSFQSAGGDYFSKGGGSQTSYSLALSENYFFKKHLFLGGNVSIGKQKTSVSNGSITEIGPQVGYLFGNNLQRAYPFISIGVNYRIEKVSSIIGKANGISPRIAMGILFTISQGMAISMEVSLMHYIMKYNSTSYTGHTINFGIGFVGIL